jgi:arylsulfatase A-like enzyme
MMRTICSILACLSLFALPLSAQSPNIIFLLTDDQRWDALGAMGNPIIQTPQMDRLAEDGVLFTHCFVTTSICMTSRATFFTGQYARRHGINDFSTDFTPEALAQTYPQLLRKAGYRIGFIGKYGVGKNLPAEAFDYFKGFPGQGHYFPEGEKAGIHLTNVMGEQALEFLDGSSAAQPFCLSVSFKAPHVQDEDPRQFLSNPTYDDVYQDVIIPPAPKSAPEFFEALPSFFPASENRKRWDMRFSTPEKYQASVKGYYKLIYGVDVVLGRIRAKLNQMEQADNTVIILIGDNGFYLGEYGLAGKWYLHEESIRVPLIIYDPRQPASQRGARVDDMALNIDVAPTILDAANLPAPPGMQGNSLLPLARGTGEPLRHEFFYEHMFEHERIPQVEGIRTERWKYVYYFGKEQPSEALFDLANDPNELRNIAADAQYADILASLRQRRQAYGVSLR